MVNGHKLYNVRFYSLSIIQSRRKWREEEKEDKSEQKRREGEEEAKAGGGREVRSCGGCWRKKALQCPFAKCGRNTRCGSHVLGSLKALLDV